MSTPDSSPSGQERAAVLALIDAKLRAFDQRLERGGLSDPEPTEYARRTMAVLREDIAQGIHA